MGLRDRLGAVVLRWKALGPVLSTLLCAALSVICGGLIVLLMHLYRERNDPWKIEPPAYALQDHSGKPRAFTPLSPAELAKTLGQLSLSDLKKWIRSRPEKWIAIGGKIDRVEDVPGDDRYAPYVRVMLEQYGGSTQLYFPLAADFRIPKDRGSKIYSVCRIAGFGYHTLYLTDCEATH